MGKKSKDSDLGRAIARRKQKDATASKNTARTATGRQASATGRHTTSHDERAPLQSVLDATDLEELMLNATMANADFTAQRYPGPLAPQTVVVTPLAQQTNGLLSAEREMRFELDRRALRIPRRPPWDASTTYQELMEREAEEFLKWRRKIATTEEEHSLASTIGAPMMTPFEKNLEVWRQLWRVVERSDIVIQIVDARNPLLYYCEDMYRYVVEEMGRSHLLLLNKSDLLSTDMIGKWETYFKSKNVDVIFFSAFKASVNEAASDSRVAGALDLIERLGKYERKAPQTHDNQRVVVGMCGYPNVGKSSTINVFLESVAAREHGERETGAPRVDGFGERRLSEDTGDLRSVEGEMQSEPTTKTEPQASREGKAVKRVAVSSTPGKTKHFQTLVLTKLLVLCDCPGLVFPNFSSSKAELICAGVLSIDQMRGDHLTPVSLIAERIPAAIFEGVYGIRFPRLTDGVLEERDASQRARPGHVSGSILLDTHARARGFMSDHDKADTSRSARVLLKDYVNGRIIYAHGPPGENGESGIGPDVFAKKGRLVYARKEARDENATASGNIESRTENGPSGSSQEQGNPVPHKTADFSEIEQATNTSGSGDVRARVSGRKKHAHPEFVRVERSFYPTAWREEDTGTGS